MERNEPPPPSDRRHRASWTGSPPAQPHRQLQPQHPSESSLPPTIKSAASSTREGSSTPQSQHRTPQHSAYAARQAQYHSLLLSASASPALPAPLLASTSSSPSQSIVASRQPSLPDVHALDIGSSQGSAAQPSQPPASSSSSDMIVPPMHHPSLDAMRAHQAGMMPGYPTADPVTPALSAHSTSTAASLSSHHAGLPHAAFGSWTPQAHMHTSHLSMPSAYSDLASSSYGPPGSAAGPGPKSAMYPAYNMFQEHKAMPSHSISESAHHVGLPQQHAGTSSVPPFGSYAPPPSTTDLAPSHLNGQAFASGPPPTTTIVDAQGHSHAVPLRNWPWAEGPAGSSMMAGPGLMSHGDPASFHQHHGDAPAVTLPAVQRAQLIGARNRSASAASAPTHFPMGMGMHGSPFVVPTSPAPRTVNIDGLTSLQVGRKRASSATKLPYRPTSFSVGSVSPIPPAVSFPSSVAVVNATNARAVASSGIGTHRRAKFKRSRTGCKVCRIRKIRCSEDGQPCKQCRVGNRACFYEPIVSPRRKGKGKKEGGSPSQHLQHTSPENENDEDNDEEEDELDTDSGGNPQRSRSTSETSPVTLTYSLPDNAPAVALRTDSDHSSSSRGVPSWSSRGSSSNDTGILSTPLAGPSVQVSAPAAREDLGYNRWMNPVASGVPGDMFGDASEFESHSPLLPMSGAGVSHGMAYSQPLDDQSHHQHQHQQHQHQQSHQRIFPGMPPS